MKKRRLLFTFITVFLSLMMLMVVPALAAPANTDGMIDPTDLTDVAIPAGFTIVAGAAYGFAELLKAATKIKRERLPLILAVFGVGFGILVVLFNPVARIPVDATWQDIGWQIICGAVFGCGAALSAVGINQMVKQGQKLKNTSDARAG